MGFESYREPRLKTLGSNQGIVKTGIRTLDSLVEFVSGDQILIDEDLSSYYHYIVAKTAIVTNLERNVIVNMVQRNRREYNYYNDPFKIPSVDDNVTTQRRLDRMMIAWRLQKREINVEDNGINFNRQINLGELPHMKTIEFSDIADLVEKISSFSGALIVVSNLGINANFSTNDIIMSFANLRKYNKRNNNTLLFYLPLELGNFDLGLYFDVILKFSAFQKDEIKYAGMIKLAKSRKICSHITGLNFGFYVKSSGIYVEEIEPNLLDNDSNVLAKGTDF